MSCLVRSLSRWIGAVAKGGGVSGDEMSKLDWAKANRVKSVKSLSDEREFLARDRAAKWLERVDLTARKAINKQSIRRIDRRQGPADQFIVS